MLPTVHFGGALRGMWALVWAQHCTTRAFIRLALGAGALGFLMLLTINSGNEKGWLEWVVGIYLHFLIPLTCLNVCGSMMRAEVQANTLSFLCTRPQRRHTLSLLQYVCHVGWLQLVLVLVVGVGSKCFLIPGLLVWTLVWVGGVGCLRGISKVKALRSSSM